MPVFCVKKTENLMAISKAKLKYYAGLSRKKVRMETGLFMAEGEKCVRDTINNFIPEKIMATSEWVEDNMHIVSLLGSLVETVTKREMEQLSALTTPSSVAAVYRIPRYDPEKFDFGSDLTIVLDGVQDPGNLGTILRTADWFGIRQIVASEDTVDLYNPKTVQATMGAIGRVKVMYTDLPQFFENHKDLPIYGTLLKGTSIYDTRLSDSGLIIFGNEGKGISSAVLQCITHPLYIPPYPGAEHGSESLNVAIATAITVSEFRRRQRK